MTPDVFPFVFQAMMTYTRRVIALELKSPNFPMQLFGQNDSLAAAVHGAAMREATGPEHDKVLLTYSIDVLTSIEVCQAALQPGALLLLQLKAEPILQATELHAYCAALKTAGFRVGIANYQGEAVWQGCLPLLSHIRMRYRGSCSPWQQALLSSSLRRRVAFIADDVETEAQLQSAIQAGFQLFQGSFAYRMQGLQWSVDTFKAGTVLLQRACSNKPLSVEAVNDFMSGGSLLMRLESLLKSAGAIAPHVLNDPRLLLADLGDAMVKRLMQICLMQDIAGQASSMLIGRLFHLARFHELMRANAFKRSASSTRFEGLLLSAFASAEQEVGGQDRHTSTLLKQISSTPMHCSAYDRNHAIAEAYRRAEWSTVEELGQANGCSFAMLNQLYRESATCARRFVKPRLQPRSSDSMRTTMAEAIDAVPTNVA